MGLAASQARLLTITARLADNELRSQTINNAKMRLATQTAQASQNYVNALNQSDLMFKNTMLDGTSQTQLLTYNALNNYSPYNTQYGLINNSGLLLVSEAEADMFKAAGGNLQKYLKAHGLAWESTYFTLKDNDEMMNELKLAYAENFSGLFEGLTKTDMESFYEAYNSAEASAEYMDYNKYRTGTLAEYKLAYAGFKNWLLGDKADGSSNTVSSFADAIATKYSLSDPTNIPNIYDKLLDSISSNTDIDVTTLKNDNYFGTYEQHNIQYSLGVNVVTIDGKQYFSYCKEEEDDCKIDNENHNIVLSDDSIITLTNDNSKISGYTPAEGAGEGSVQTLSDGSNVLYVKEPNKDFYVEQYTYKDGKLYNTSVLPKDENNNNESLVVDIIESLLADMLDNNKVFNTFLASQVSKSFNKESITNLLKFMFGTNSDGIANNPLKDLNDIAVNEYADMDKVLNKLYEMNSTDYDEMSNSGQFKGDFIAFLVDKNVITQEYANMIRMHQVDVMVAVYGEPKYAWSDSTDKSNTGNPDSRAQWYTNLFNRMQNGYQVLEDGLASSNDWIEYAFKNGLVSMEQVDSNFNWVALNYQTCVAITEQTDNSAAVAKAEAEYNRAMNDIKQKDSIYDLQLKNIDTEHNSLQQEYESISKVISKNIERTMKFDQSG